MTVTVRMIAVTIVLTAIAGFAGPATAQSQNCTGNSGIDWDIQIGACTTAIQSGRWKGKDLAWAFNNRGVAYRNKDQYDRAIQDYDQAIKLDPNNASAFNNRGAAYALARPTGEFLRWKTSEWPVLVLRCSPANAVDRVKWYLDVTFGPHRIKAIDTNSDPPSDFGITVDEERQVIVQALYLRFSQTVKTLELPGSLMTAMRRAKTLTFDRRPHVSTEVRVSMNDFALQFDQQLKHTPACRIQ